MYRLRMFTGVRLTEKIYLLRQRVLVEAFDILTGVL